MTPSLVESGLPLFCSSAIIYAASLDYIIISISKQLHDDINPI